MAYEAGRVVAELEARNGQFDTAMRGSAQVVEQSMSRVERSALDAERSVARSSTGIVRSSGQVAQATRNLGFQISDVGAQLSGGQSPFLIFGQQAPQFAQAFNEISAAGANLGTVLRSIALPGILAVVSVLATLIEKQYSAADASKTHAKASDFLKEATDRLTAAAARNNHQTEIGITLDLRAAEAKRQNAIRTRQLIEAELKKQQTALSAADATEGAAGATGQLGIPGRGVASRRANISDLNRQLRDNSKAIEGFEKNIKTAQASTILRNIAAQTDRATAATQRYDDQIDKLTRRFERGAIDAGTFERLSLAAKRTRDAALDGAKATDRASTSSRGHTVNLRLQSDASREAAAAQRELEAALTGLIRKYDPAAAAAADYAAELQKIADLEKSGKATTEQAGRFREGAASEFRKARAGLFTLESVENLRPGIEQEERDAKDQAQAEAQAAADAERNTQAARESNIRSLANLYEDVFTRSSGQVWDNFKRDGLRALAVVLAQATVTSFSSGGGGFGSLLKNITSAAGSAFGGVPKFATGGSMLVGGRGGTDQNLLSLNGQPIAAVSKGETLNIAPNTRAAAQRSAAPATVNQYFTLDLRGGITTPQIMAGVQTYVEERGQQVGQAAYRGAVRDAPVVAAKQRPLKS